MAEALLAAALPENFSIGSAGIAALEGHPADPDAVALMAERGLDITGHTGRQLDETILTNSDLLLVMERTQGEWIEAHWPQARGRVFLWGHWSEQEIPDPYRRGKQAFEHALAQIETGLEEWKNKLGAGA